MSRTRSSAPCQTTAARPMTIPLLPNSPAIGTRQLEPSRDANDRPARSDSRLNDGSLVTSIDIGAFEVSSSYLVTTPSDSAIPGTLRSAINWANANAGTSPDFHPLRHQGGVQRTADHHPVARHAGLDRDRRRRSASKARRDHVTISGNGAVGVFSIASNVTATFTGLTIADGSAATDPAAPSATRG